MKTLSLVITLAGILLLFLLQFLPPLSISSPDDLTNLEANQKVLVTGKVIQERFSKTSRVLVLDNILHLHCDCSLAPPLQGKSIIATALLDTFSNKSTLRILTLSTQPSKAR